jgi:hypothetical protein
MTPLRHNITNAKRAYQTARYPGNLATDILPHKRRTWRIPLAISSLAAAFLLLVMIHHAADSHRSQMNQPDTTLMIGGLPDWSSVSQGTSLSVPYPSFTIPPMPSFPTVRSEGVESSPTSRNAV